MIPKNSLRILFILTLTMTIFLHVSYSQVQNRFIDPDDAKYYGVNIPKLNSVSSYKLPQIDVKQLLREDSIENIQGKPFRFGKAIDVDLLSEGLKYGSLDTTFVFYLFTSKSAYSLNLIFDEFVLAPNASLLIFNSEKSMVYGPIQKINNPDNGIFWTDLIKGESLILQLTIVGAITKET